MKRVAKMPAMVKRTIIAATLNRRSSKLREKISARKENEAMAGNSVGSSSGKRTSEQHVRFKVLL